MLWFAVMPAAAQPNMVGIRAWPSLYAAWCQQDLPPQGQVALVQGMSQAALEAGAWLVDASQVTLLSSTDSAQIWRAIDRAPMNFSSSVADRLQAKLTAQHI